MIEFPKPVPGPKTPLVCFGFIFKPFNETKLSSGSKRSPKDTAIKSLRKTKWPIFKFNPNFYPSSSPHLVTLDKLTLLS